MQQPLPKYLWSVGDYLYAYNGMETDHELSGHGNSYTTQFRQYDPRLGRWKSLDPMARKFVDKSPYFGMGNNPNYFVDLFGGEPTPAEAAAMSKHVYGGADAAPGVLIGGWEVVPDAEATFDIKLNDDSGFKSQLYRRQKTDGSYEYFYATAGTEFESADDLIADAEVWATGNTPQFTISVSNAQKLDEAMTKSGSELTFGGHSLGGGLATVNGMKTNRKVITFNTMAMNDRILIEHKILDEKHNTQLVDNYILLGEILWQFSFLDQRSYYVGENFYLLDGNYIAEKFIPPFIPGETIYKAYQAANRHRIDSVIAEMKDDNLWASYNRFGNTQKKIGSDAKPASTDTSSEPK